MSRRIVLAIVVVFATLITAQVQPTDAKLNCWNEDVLTHMNPAQALVCFASRNLNRRYENGMTALHAVAAATVNPDVIAALVGIGAQLNARSMDGYTPARSGGEEAESSRDHCADQRGRQSERPR